MPLEEKFQRDIRDAITRRELLKALTAMSAIALLPISKRVESFWLHELNISVDGFHMFSSGGLGIRR
ncbi:hypothetical protein [Vulcanisaeta sp. JCM 16159]|uniref:hypothetical protein n=1 Tax=Vulcanisaeta sp. JCM 16159 TaxID=1295371 RepID=UPI001FB438ED|nr:hypothetical protein [Vulcanisaeta sp. JCM 16159]